MVGKSHAVPTSFAYIPNASGNLAVINTLTDDFPEFIGISNGATGVAVSPDGRTVYATGTSEISIVDAESGSLKATLPIGNALQSIAVSPDGEKVFVTHLTNNVVYVLDAKTLLISDSIAVGSPTFVCVSPDNKFVYISSLYGVGVDIFEMETFERVHSIAHGGAIGIVFHPDGGKVYINSVWGAIAVVSTTTFIKEGVVPVSESSWGNPVITPDGRYLYIPCDYDKMVAVMDTKTNTVIKNIPAYYAFLETPRSPRGLSINTDGSKVYVVADEMLYIINTATQSVTHSILLYENSVSTGNSISPLGCDADTQFKIKVFKAGTKPYISHTEVSSLSACIGIVSPAQEFTVSAARITSDLLIEAPANFELSLTEDGLYSNLIAITPVDSTVSSVSVFVRSSSSAPGGNISGY
jgi:YVTN family beta-propeller protein